tara:strand:- start:3755 stop:4765 length:1011 start_codon:yes stop_codon:yes gene_type:complete
MINKLQNLRRRDFCRLALISGYTTIYGCTKGINNPIFLSTSESIPKEWLRELPSPWSHTVLKEKNLDSDNNLNKYYQNADLISIGDGWLQRINNEDFNDIYSGAFSSKLNKKAKEFIGSWRNSIQSKILPIGFSPWVMIFRNGEKWSVEASKDWSVLLDNELKGKIIFPRSPRLMISIAKRIGGSNTLRNLRRQALAFDDRNGLNWISSGKAKVAVLPLSRCFDSLMIDPRLNIAFPINGAPLNWTLLLSPAKTKEPLPQEWLAKSLTKPLLSLMLARGWTPPIDYMNLSGAMNLVPTKYQSTILPPSYILDRCWSFGELNTKEKYDLEEEWRIAS